MTEDNSTPEEDDFVIEQEGEDGVDIVDDTPPDDRDRPRRADGEEPQVDIDDEEREKYSKNVQKRIKQLTYEYHEERRGKEEAERMRDEAMKYAQAAHQSIQEMQRQIAEGRNVLHGESTARVDAQIANAKEKLRAAYDSGDSEKIVEAQAEISTAIAEKTRIEAMKTVPAREPEPQRQPQQTQQQQQHHEPERPKPTQAALDWWAENDWFGKDGRMTAYAQGVSNEIITSGVKPDSKEYYRQIDAEMRKVFPDRFEGAASDNDPDGTVVAAPSRATGKKPRKVRLTKTQVALAKKLGVPLEEYARQVMKEANNG